MRARCGSTGRTARRIALAGGLAAAALAPLGLPPAPAAGAQQTERVEPARPARLADVGSLPFGVGETLTYRVRVSKMGAVGRGAMWVEGPVDVRGTPTYLLRFDFRAGVGPLKAEDHTESWLDPLRMTALRFHKRERHPISRGTERVELFPGERRWEDEDGRAGASPTDEPLDELSFIYFVRTLPLEPGEVHHLDRHYEAGRNPVTVRVLGRDTVTTGAGTFPTIVVEMRVRDARRYKSGEGVIRLHLTDDHCRLPVRIESEMPVVGKAVLSLESYVRAPAALVARSGAGL